MPQAEQNSRLRSLGAAARARKWLVGIVLAGIAAAITGVIASGITSGAHRVQHAFEQTPAPVGFTLVDVKRPSKFSTGHYVFTRPIESIPFPTKSEGNLGYLETWDAWARRHGGVEADRTFVQFVVEGNTPLPVVLTGLTVDVTQRAPAPKGVHIAPFGGGPVGVRYFDVNLDRDPPVVGSVPAEFTKEPAIDFPYRVSQTEPEVFSIAASTGKCDCRWRALLHWVYKGKTGVTVIDDRGRPFRTVSGLQSTLYTVNNGRFVKGT